MPKALAGTTGTCRLCRRAETRLPNDAVSVAPTLSAIPKILWEPEFIVRRSRQNVRTIPSRPRVAPAITWRSGFNPKRSQLLRMLKTTSKRKDDGYAAGHEVFLGLIEQDIVCLPRITLVPAASAANALGPRIASAAGAASTSQRESKSLGQTDTLPTPVPEFRQVAT